MRNPTFLIALTTGLLALSAAFPAWESHSMPGTGLQSLATHPWDHSKVLAASRNEIYVSNSKNSWERLRTFQVRNIQKIMSFETIHDAFFILTKDAIYRYSFSESTVEKIFEKANITVLSFGVLPDDPDHFFAGTTSGLYESDNAGKIWFPFEFLKNRPISMIKFKGDHLFLAVGNELYFSRDLSTFSRLFSLPSSEPDWSESSSEATEEDEVILTYIHDMAWDEKTLWLATDQGVFQSPNGRQWETLSSSGLKSTRVLHLAFSGKNHSLFSGTENGVYHYQMGYQRWEELYKGLQEPRIAGLVLIQDKEEKLFALSSSSLFEIPLLPGEGLQLDFQTRPETTELMRQLFHLEPSVQDLQKQTVRHNDLSQGKIKRWQAESRMSALLPDFSFDKDVNLGNSVDIDRGATNTPDEYILGPDNIDRGWGWSVSWDLGDFIWNSAQTNIDSRSKLNAEARRDFLSELTRLYFERRRLQMEILNSRPSTELEHQERLLRMDELTALIDGLTGGYLSRKLKSLYERHPELEGLWAFAGAQEQKSQEHK